MKLAAARIFVDDLPAARHFYNSVLGLRLLHDSSEHGYLVLDAGGFDLVIEAVAGDPGDDEVGLVGRFTGLSLAVTDLAETHTQLSAAGVRFRSAPERQSWGGWLATFADPAGNALQLVQYPADH
ncbi:MAG: VOC family protein [Burkholderiales bacterium]|nr:VOC family protein [Burkholderiales bacterium]